MPKGTPNKPKVDTVDAVETLEETKELVTENITEVETTETADVKDTEVCVEETIESSTCTEKIEECVEQIDKTSTCPTPEVDTDKLLELIETEFTGDPKVIGTPYAVEEIDEPNIQELLIKASLERRK